MTTAVAVLRLSKSERAVGRLPDNDDDLGMVKGRPLETTWIPSSRKQSLEDRVLMDTEIDILPSI